MGKFYLRNITDKPLIIPKYGYQGKMALAPGQRVDIQENQISFFRPYEAIGVRTLAEMPPLKDVTFKEADSSDIKKAVNEDDTPTASTVEPPESSEETGSKEGEKVPEDEVSKEDEKVPEDEVSKEGEKVPEDEVSEKGEIPEDVPSENEVSDVKVEPLKINETSEGDVTAENNISTEDIVPDLSSLDYLKSLSRSQLFALAREKNLKVANTRQEIMAEELYRKLNG